MKTKLAATFIVVAFALAGCQTAKDWFHSSQGQATVADLEQYVLSEATGYFTGTLTLQQLIDNAKAKFASFTSQQILDVILNKLDDSSVVPPATTTHLMARRPLVMAEKREMETAGYSTGVTFIRNGGTPDQEVHAKSLLARRLAYRYRVWPSKVRALS